MTPKILWLIITEKASQENTNPRVTQKDPDRERENAKVSKKHKPHNTRAACVWVLHEALISWVSANTGL